MVRELGIVSKEEKKKKKNRPSSNLALRTEWKCAPVEALGEGGRTQNEPTFYTAEAEV
jgi:hypothetical protein